jgi:ribulose-bisphosphate carboxylase small chain
MLGLHNMQDYQSSLGNAESRKFETFSYLPTLTAEQMRVRFNTSLNRNTVSCCACCVTPWVT